MTNPLTLPPAMSRQPALVFLLLALGLILPSVSGLAQHLTVGSKRFTESYILAEISKSVLEEAGYSVEHRQGLGGTVIAWEALKSGSILVYPDYTGTIKEVILKSAENISEQTMGEKLANLGVGMTNGLGFNNTYAIAMRRDHARQLGITRISDLKNHPLLVAGITHEMLERNDGWHAMLRHYGFAMQRVRGLDHAISYAAIATGEIDLMDAYSTDAKLVDFDLIVLADDHHFFPEYNAVFLYNLKLPAKAVSALESLTGTIDESLMIRLNAAAERENDYGFAATLYFEEVQGRRINAQSSSTAGKLWAWTLEHLFLVGVSMLIAILAGIPLGILASTPGTASQFILGSTGIIQTIPSLALLALLVPIPFLGISSTTAILALFLYSLLPIVRNTAAGLQNIPLSIRESAEALGLERGAQLRKIMLPMASRTILAGIKTSAIINVGTATLAALIGAGGLGEPIISGLALNDSSVILQGAIPAALLAILVQLLFEVLDKLLIPRGLRLTAEDDTFT